jgi:hypothetical protein
MTRRATPEEIADHDHDLRKNDDGIYDDGIEDTERDTEREIIDQLREAQVELLLIGAMDDEVSASDLRSIIEQLELAILLIQLQR